MNLGNCEEMVIVMVMVVERRSDCRSVNYCAYVAEDPVFMPAWLTMLMLSIVGLKNGVGSFVIQVLSLEIQEPTWLPRLEINLTGDKR